MTSPTTVPGLLQTLAADPGRPRLTWYGPDGERIELSGHVLDNWVTKTANLLAEEFGAGPSHRVRLDLPPHWRTVVWALAVWRVGAHVVLDDDSVDLVVTDHPERHPEAVELVAVALPALARSFDGTLPAGAVDAASAVMTYGDVLTWMPEPVPTAGALSAYGGTTTDHAGLLTWARDQQDEEVAAGARVLLLTEGTASSDVASTLATCLAAYAADGSVVLCSAGRSAEIAADADLRERLVTTERVTSPA